MRRSLRVCLATLATPLALTKVAAQTPSVEPRAVFDLGTIVVTAQRRAPLPAATAIIPLARMQLLDQTRVAEALDFLPGISASPGGRGGVRNERRIYLRGFDTLQTPFLVDGVPFYIVWDGEPADLNRFTTFDLAATEVAKGYTPLGFGPGTLGGAINLVTRKPSRNFEGEAGVGLDLGRAGAFGAWRADAQIGMARERWYIQAGVAALDRTRSQLPEDFRAAGAVRLTPAPPGNLENGGFRDRSYARDIKFNVKLGLTPREGDEYAILFARQDGRKGAPPYAGPPNPNQTVNFFDWPLWDKQTIALFSTTQLAGDALVLKARAYADLFKNGLERYDNNRYDTQATAAAFSSRYDDRAYGGSVTLEATPFEGNIVRAITHLRFDDHREVPNALPGRQTGEFAYRDFTTSLGLETEQRLSDALRLSASVSWDRRDARKAPDQQQGGRSFALGQAEAINAQLGAVWSLGSGGEVFASVARKSRFASQFERYSYRLGNGVPNAGLKPERATNLQAGWRGTFRAVDIEAAVFQSDIDGLIQSVPISVRATPPFGTIVQNLNVGEARFRGFESSVGGEILPGVTAQLSYAWIDRKITRGQRLALFGVPRHTVSGYVTASVTERLDLTLSAQAASRRQTSNVADGEPVDGWLTLGLKAAYRLTDRISIEVSARNLFDRLVYFDYGFPEDGRSFALTVRARI